MQTQTSPDRAAKGGGRDGVILIVDDEPEILEMIGTALSQVGMNVMTALNGDIALVILQSGIRIDLLFTDIVMSGSLNGIALAREAKQIQPGIKILYGTGYAGLLAEEKTPLLGEILHKPYRLAELVRRVKALTAEDAAGPGARLGRA
jgi:CheY-like chemotaxis protein